MRLDFTKMHGLGNDFIVVDAPTNGPLPAAATWQRLADRHTGIGFDQALVIFRPRQAGTDIFYRIFNADGGEVEQCGNGARCFVRFVHEQGLTSAREIRVETRCGVIAPRLEADGQVTVDMGAPRFEAASLPFLPGAPGVTPVADGARHAVELAGRRVEFAIASMGNPHAVILVDDVASAPVAEIGAALQRHPSFPQSVNVGFMQLVDDAHIRLRVFERGVGETLACGTGACAAVAVGRKAGRLAGDVEVALPGGKLRIRWSGAGEPLWMTGPADVAFRGQVEL